MEPESSILLFFALVASIFLIKIYCLTPSKPSLSQPNHPQNEAFLHSTNNNATNINTDNDDPSVLYSQIKASNDQLSLDAINFIKQILTEYGIEHLAFSFNGGKDCMVLLYLIRIALKLLHKKDEHLSIIWFQRNNEFNELTEFLRFCVKKFNFPLFETCNDYKSGLEEYLKNGNPECKAVFLGQRSTDPWCGNLELASHCTSGWPDIMRINPILKWSYNDVWRFLVNYNLAYCCLYDQGYTSLGDIKETIPNPLLYDRHLFRFKAASKLKKKYQKAERFGRLIRHKNKNENEDKLIRDKIKCLIVCGRNNLINENVKENVKLAIESSFVNDVLRNKEKMSVDIELIENDDGEQRLKWCKLNYLYTFYANICDDSS